MVKSLPYKPSKILETFSHDKADENEGIVVALSPCRYGKKVDKFGKVTYTGVTFPHEVKVGDRVIFPGSYQDEDTTTINGVKYRFIEPDKIVCILHAPQPEGFENPVTGEKIEEKLIIP